MRRVFSASTGKREYIQKVQTFWMRIAPPVRAAAGKGLTGLKNAAFPPFAQALLRRKPVCRGVAQ
ncbi:MAG: hypothetical protein AB7W06_21075, partial [Alphaproteobacteria bacterium]